MLWRALEKTPSRSSHESPFHSYLQPRSFKITSWEHLTIAHLPVHPPTPHAKLKHSHPRITQRERQHCKSLCHSSCQTQPLWVRLTSSNKPSSTSNSKQTSILLCTL
ncbi:hypothetical protein GOODEAATRI_005621 [Goodea atripinnis]|uniref:Uncharacterized protein n=1 Tax=Goodea atripinnis TaxID=208336 RepID=A0ABV0MPL8_9TELE